MTPGWKTSEGWLTAFKALAGAAMAICTVFGIAVPAAAGPSGPWVGVAAFIASTTAVTIYGKDRSALKKQAAVLDTATGTTTTGTQDSAPFVPVTVNDAGYGLIEVCFAVLLLVIALVVLFHYVR